jgi:hypothetical protein
MIRYRIEIETMYSKFYLKKEYYSYPQALKARRMMKFDTDEWSMIRIYLLKNDVNTQLMNTVNSSMSKN